MSMDLREHWEACTRAAEAIDRWIDGADAEATTTQPPIQEPTCERCGGSSDNPQGCMACCRDCGFPCDMEKDGEGFHDDGDDEQEHDDLDCELCLENEDDSCAHCHADWKARPHEHDQTCPRYKAKDATITDPDYDAEAYPRTVSDWQIYSGMEGNEQAAAILTAGLDAAVAYAQTLIKAGFDPVDAGQRAYSEMWCPVASHKDCYKYGSRDTEPESVAVVAIEKRLGLEQWSLHR